MCIANSPELRHLHGCIEKKHVSNIIVVCKLLTQASNLLILFWPNALQTCIFSQHYMHENLFFFQSLPLVLLTNKKDVMF